MKLTEVEKESAKVKLLQVDEEVVQVHRLAQVGVAEVKVEVKSRNMPLLVGVAIIRRETS